MLLIAYKFLYNIQYLIPCGRVNCVPLSVGWPGLALPLALPYWLEGGMVALQIIVWKVSGGRRQLFGGITSIGEFAFS